MLATQFDIYTPFNGFSNVVERVNANPVSSPGNSDENTPFLHNHHAFEGDPANESIGLTSGGPGERQHVKTLGVAEEKIVWREKGAMVGSIEMRRREFGGDRGQRQAQFCQRRSG